MSLSLIVSQSQSHTHSRTHMHTRSGPRAHAQAHAQACTHVISMGSTVTALAVIQQTHTYAKPSAMDPDLWTLRHETGLTGAHALKKYMPRKSCTVVTTCG